MIKKYFNLTIIILFCACFLFCANSNKVNFKNFPADYRIAYFEDIGVANIPSIKNLFGRNASFADEFMGTDTYVVIESYKCTNSEFDVSIIVRVKETNYDIFRCNLIFEADNTNKKNYVRYIKAESLLSEQYLESESDGTPEKDMEAFELFIRYMHLLWK